MRRPTVQRTVRGVRVGQDLTLEGSVEREVVHVSSSGRPCGDALRPDHGLHGAKGVRRREVGWRPRRRVVATDGLPTGAAARDGPARSPETGAAGPRRQTGPPAPAAGRAPPPARPSPAGPARRVAPRDRCGRPPEAPPFPPACALPGTPARRRWRRLRAPGPPRPGPHGPGRPWPRPPDGGTRASDRSPGPADRRFLPAPACPARTARARGAAARSVPHAAATTPA